MEFSRNNVNNSENATPPTNSGDQQGSSSTIKWSDEFQCYTVNGILSPFPLSAIPMEDVANYEQPDSESSRPDEPNRKKKKTEGKSEFFFKLFKFPNATEQYLLEMHEVETDSIERQHVMVMKSNGKWKVGIYDLAPGDHLVVPVLQDPSPPVFPKSYQLSLEERLVGWTVEKRKRGNGKEDKGQKE